MVAIDTATHDELAATIHLSAPTYFCNSLSVSRPLTPLGMTLLGKDVKFIEKRARARIFYLRPLFKSL